MKKGATVREELMQANMAGIRRNLKNLAHNYSDAQIKVREATSNDPWGPSSTLMSEIADLTYNVMAFTDIMQMIWKRLNDHGRNWRHVYKALVLLEYLIKTGTEKVAQQCKENIFAIQTLKDFQYFEESKDHGLNVREKAKQLVFLLKDEERLRNERARALKAKERFAQAASGFGSDGMESTSPSSPSFPSYHGQWTSCEGDASSRGSPGGCRSPTSGVAATTELECARPQTVGEEELQLQLALAMSREEAEQEEQRRRSDDVRLQLALSQSEEEFKHALQEPPEKQSHMLDLLDVNLGSMTPPAVQQPPHLSSGVHGLGGAAPAVTLDPWGMPTSAVPPPAPHPVTHRVLQHQSPLGSPVTRPQNDPWSSSPATGSASTSIVDPWAPVDTPTPPVDPWKPAEMASRSLGGTPTPSQARTVQNPWSPTGGMDTSEYYSGATPSPLASPASNGAGASSQGGNELLDEFDAIYQREKPLNTNGVLNNNNNNNGMSSPDPFDLSSLDDGLPVGGKDKMSATQKKTPASFLGENSSLVNLDNLVPVPPGTSKTHPLPAPSVPTATSNPFSPTPIIPPSSTVQPSMFQPQQISRKSPFMATEDAFAPVPTVDARPWGNPVLPTPILPNSAAGGNRVIGESQRPNPFLS